MSHIPVQCEMFEFAISQQQKHPPSRRFLASMVVSLACHVLFLTVLIEYPQLLGPGLKKWIERSILVSSTGEAREPAWRTVAILGGKDGPMKMPSAATLRADIYDWAAHQGSGKNPPIRVRWNGEAADGGEKKAAPLPKPVPGLEEPKPVPQIASTTPSAEPSAESGAAGGGVGAGESSGGRGVTVYLPAPQPQPNPAARKPAENAGMVAPTSIPKEVPSPPPPTTGSSKGGAQASKPAQAQVFDNEQKALRSEGSGLFDTKGFPLGDYASLVIERVKGNWSIPSNLRNSQGRTTVIFFIDKDGHFTDARIVASSGSNSLDLCALNAIIGSNPFPPLPKGFPGEHVGAKFVFSYNERQ